MPRVEPPVAGRPERAVPRAWAAGARTASDTVQRESSAYELELLSREAQRGSAGRRARGRPAARRRRRACTRPGAPPSRRRRRPAPHRPDRMIAYLDVQNLEPGGYLGGLLVVDEFGLPVEFRHTRRAAPERAAAHALRRRARPLPARRGDLRAPARRPREAAGRRARDRPDAGRRRRLAARGAHRAQRRRPARPAGRDAAVDGALPASCCRSARGEPPWRVISKASSSNFADMAQAIVEAAETFDVSEPPARVRAALTLLAAGRAGRRRVSAGRARRWRCAGWRKRADARAGRSSSTRPRRAAWPIRRCRRGRASSRRRAPTATAELPRDVRIRDFDLAPLLDVVPATLRTQVFALRSVAVDAPPPQVRRAKLLEIEARRCPIPALAAVALGARARRAPGHAARHADRRRAGRARCAATSRRSSAPPARPARAISRWSASTTARRSARSAASPSTSAACRCACGRSRRPARARSWWAGCGPAAPWSARKSPR